MSEIKKYLRSYKFNSLFFRNLRQIMLLIMIPIAGLCIAVSLMYGKWSKTEMKNYSDKMTQSLKTKWEQVMDSCERDLFYIKSNDWVELFFYDKKMQQLSYRYEDIRELVRFPILSKDYVDDVFLYAANSGYVLNRMSVTPCVNSEEKPHIDLWNSQQVKSGILLCQEPTGGHQGNQLLLYSPSAFAEQKGLCVMKLNVQHVVTMLTVQENCGFYITNDGTVLLSSDKNAVGLTESELDVLRNTNSSAVEMRDGFLINRIALNEEGLELITLIREQDVIPQVGFWDNVLLVLCGAVLLISVLMAVHISARLYKPIGEILYFLQTVEKEGDFESYAVNDEAEYILHSIKKQMYFSEDIAKELKERMQLLRKAQIVALQAQINPHFINNTLDTINWMAIRKLGENNELSETLRVLADMLRMLFREKDTLIPIRKEIEHARNYLFIQQIRQPGHFQVIWNIPDKIQQQKTIPVVLQPIVENAVCHGLDQLSEDGYIRISASVAPDAVVFEVEDNGLGMDEDEISALHNQMQQAMTKENNHIGLSNVNQRLKLWFGDEYGVFLESKKYFGTKVTVRIPNIAGEG